MISDDDEFEFIEMESEPPTSAVTDVVERLVKQLHISNRENANVFEIESVLDLVRKEILELRKENAILHARIGELSAEADLRMIVEKVLRIFFIKWNSKIFWSY